MNVYFDDDDASSWNIAMLRSIGLIFKEKMVICEGVITTVDLHLHRTFAHLENSRALQNQ